MKAFLPHLVRHARPGSDRAATMIRLLSHVRPDLPRIGLPRTDRMVVVAPHPDDETIGAGGTIALAVDRGVQTTVVVVTDGEATMGSARSPAEIGARRRTEALLACRALGVDDVRHLGLPDGRVADHLDAVVTAVGDQVLDRRAIVVCPWPLDRHADHLAVARAVAIAVGDRPDVEVWGFEAHVPTIPTRLVDITDVVGRKQRALDAHATAGGSMRLRSTLALNEWRSLVTRGGGGWAEAFLTAPGPAWADLVAATQEDEDGAECLACRSGRAEVVTGEAAEEADTGSVSATRATRSGAGSAGRAARPDCSAAS